MIAYTVGQAAARIFVTPDTIETWITVGHLHAIRNPIDGHRYIEETHLLGVDRDLRNDRTPQPRPDPLTADHLAHWLADHGRPTTTRTIRDWIETGRLTPTIPARPGPKGWAARYDPLNALAVAHTLDQGAHR